MEYYGKTNEELIAALKKLQYDHNALKESHERNLAKRKESAQKLIISDEKYLLLIDRMPDGVYKSTAAGEFVNVNQALVEMLGYDSKEELMSIHIPTQLYVEIADRESVQLNEKNEELGIYRLKKKDGSEIWVEDHGWTNYDQTTGVLYHEGVMRNVTDRVYAEKALLESEKRFRLLYENAPLAYQSLNAEGCLIDVNPTWLHLLGYEKEEVIGRHFGEFMKPESAELVKSRFSRFMKEGEIKHAEFEMIRKDGASLIVSYEGKIGKDELGNFKQTHCIFTDITERKKVEDDLREKSDFINKIIDSSAVPIWIADSQGTAIKANQACLDFFGVTEEEGIGKYNILKDNVLEGLGEMPRIKNVFEKGEAASLILNYSLNDVDHIVVKNAKRKTVNSILTPILDKDGAVINVIVQTIDLTEIKNKEQELISAKERAEESEHYLQNIINNIGDPVFVKDENSRLLIVNEAFCEMFQLTRTDIIGKTLTEDVSPEEREKFLKIDKQVLDDGLQNVSEETLTIRGGETRTILTSKTRFLNNSVEKYLIGVIKDITKIKKTKEELILAKEKAEVSEQKYKTLFDFAPIPYQSLNSEGIIREINPAWLDLLGYEEDEVVGKWYGDFLHPDVLPTFIENFPTLKTCGRVGNVPFRLRRKDGSYIYVSLDGNSGYNPDGSFKQTFCVFKDITDQKQAEIALSKSKDLLSETGHLAKVGGWEIDLNGNTLAWTDETYKIHELPPGNQPDVAGAINYYHPDDRAMVASCVEKSINEAIPFDFEARIITAQGNTKWVRASGNPILLKGAVCGIRGSIQDITERKQAEIELLKAKEIAEESENKLLEAQELSHVGSWEYNVDTDKVAWSKELYNIFEHPYNLPPPKFSEQQKFYTEESFARLEKAVEECVQLGIPYEIELDIYTSRGSIKHIISKGKIKKDRNNKVIGSYGTAQDVTAQKKLDLELIQAKQKAEESDRLKSAFLANMSHEIRTPMNGILGFSELLKNPHLSDEKQQKYIEIIEKSGSRMLNIINDIVDISKIEAGLIELAIKESNINEQIEYVYTFFKPEVEAKGMQLFYKNTLPIAEAVIKTDREKLFAILTNIVKNAIKYSNEGFIEFGYHKKGDYLEFFVKDTGIGIPKDRQEAIFERFIQADINDNMARQGAGLGLSITKSYVEMLGGEIWVESMEGKGSIFYFTLPYTYELKVENKANDVNAINEKTNQIKKLKILIAEDDETSEMLLSINVSAFSREILKARTGVEAVEACKNNQDIDLILMDIQMPDLNGYEATRQIRKFNEDVIIIAQTAFGLTGDLEKSLAAGCNNYIKKPINKNELTSLIQKYFQK